jgi:hypothetical protein
MGGRGRSYPKDSKRPIRPRAAGRFSQRKTHSRHPCKNGELKEEKDEMPKMCKEKIGGKSEIFFRFIG